MTRSSGISVLHLLAPAPFGGLETVVATLASGLVEAGDDVAVALVVDPREADGHPMEVGLRDRGITTGRIVVGTRDYRLERKAVHALLVARGAQVLHTHGYRPDVVDAPIARRLRIPTVTTVHGLVGGSWRNRLYEWVQVRRARSFDAVIAVSQRLSSHLRASGVDPGRLHTVRNAWHTTVPALDSAAARLRLGLAARDGRVGWVGRLSLEKGPEDMIRSLRRVQRENLHLSIVGAGPLEGPCRELAGSLDLGSRVTFHGPTPDAGSLLRAFDVLVMTSHTEGTPMVLLEAMAAGVPVVTTAVGGIPDVVSSAEAHLCDPGRPDQIARAIDDVFANPEAARIRAEAAKARLERDFAVGPWVERHREIYHSIMQA